jgi:putative ABC transport system permease protein
MALSLGACLLILSLVYYEIGFEDCHERADRIYRIGGTWIDGDVTQYLKTVMHPLGPALKEALPEVEEQVRLRALSNVTLTAGHDRTFSESKFLIADASVFGVFSIPLVDGDPATALAAPRSVVISEAARRRLFAGGSPIGESITLFATVTLTVTGVMRNLPKNTQIRTDYLASYDTSAVGSDELQVWNRPRAFEAYTYLLMRADAGPAAVEAKLARFLTARLGDDALKCYLQLQPLHDLYFHSGLGGSAPGDKRSASPVGRRRVFW